MEFDPIRNIDLHFEYSLKIRNKNKGLLEISSHLEAAINLRTFFCHFQRQSISSIGTWHIYIYICDPREIVCRFPGRMKKKSCFGFTRFFLFFSNLLSLIPDRINHRRVITRQIKERLGSRRNASSLLLLFTSPEKYEFTNSMKKKNERAGEREEKRN